jgi:class 3 adenylate cyclase/tetratricopeptide (TPR) repeat protein
MRACPGCGLRIDAEFAFCPRCGAQLSEPPPAREQRKTVTVIFCDVTGSTALGDSVDPEALRALLARYFERMKAIVESHGGTVEKFIGDAVMAVFGVPVVHEDDALRAVRAAAEMREALPELGLQARIGVNSGEVVTGTEERLATGDAVNVAARLEQSATPGDVLLGKSTFALVRDAIEVEAVAPLAVRGKSEPVQAHKLVRIRGAPERRHETHFVGRHRELALVRDAWARALSRNRCELVTIVGDAGVGKSRLVAEALAPLDSVVARGRCLPYGEGITYWPVVEVLKQLDTVPRDAEAASAIRSLLGEEDAPASAEEIAWAFRKTLEQAALVHSLMVVFDDIHSGEETFLDLIEHVALLSSGSPFLLLCMARPELTERRPDWPVLLRLGPLASEDVERLIPDRFRGRLRERISEAAGGNPLFIGEILSMADAERGGIVVPPTLQALLGARLDQLETHERTVLQCAAVEGEIFHRGAVQALAPAESTVTPRLAALVRKELIAPDRAQIPGEDGFRFRHLLIRDAAYTALPKAVRADLHARFARWLEEHGTGLVELDELLGYHLEQAVHYRVELGERVDYALSAAARARLTTAGRRALGRLDFAAAVSLLRRAVALVPSTELDLGLETDLIDALSWAQREDEALGRARSIAERSAASSDRIGELCGRIEAGTLSIVLRPEGATKALEALLAEALPEFEAAGHDLALRIAYRAVGDVANMRCQMDRLVDAYEQAEAHAGPAGLTTVVGYQSHGRLHGSAPLTEVLAWQGEQDPREQRGYWLRTHRATALAMLGRLDEARAVITELRTELIERGARTVLADVEGHYRIDVEVLAGDPTAAVAAGEESLRLHDELGQPALLSTVEGNLANAYCELGRLQEAEELAARSAELGASDDVLTQMLWRRARAKVQAHRGQHPEAERLAREAVEIAEQTESPNAQADAYADLGMVLALAGRADEAGEALEQALERFERKENRVMAERMRNQLAALRKDGTRLDRAGLGNPERTSPGG